MSSLSNAERWVKTKCGHVPELQAANLTLREIGKARLEGTIPSFCEESLSWTRKDQVCLAECLECFYATKELRKM
jgi:hypothetical protein